MTPLHPVWKPKPGFVIRTPAALPIFILKVILYGFAFMGWPRVFHPGKAPYFMREMTWLEGVLSNNKRPFPAFPIRGRSCFPDLYFYEKSPLFSFLFGGRFTPSDVEGGRLKKTLSLSRCSSADLLPIAGRKMDHLSPRFADILLLW